MSRILRWIVCCALLASPRFGSAQGTADREAVRLAALDYVEGFYLGDTTRLIRSVSPEVRKVGYDRASATAPYVVETMPFREFLSYANRIRTGQSKTPAGAKKEIQIFEVQDQTASVKVTAWWGTDYLLLAKEKGRWVILHVLWQSPPPK